MGFITTKMLMLGLLLSQLLNIRMGIRIFFSFKIDRNE